MVYYVLSHEFVEDSSKTFIYLFFYSISTSIGKRNEAGYTWFNSRKYLTEFLRFIHFHTFSTENNPVYYCQHVPSMDAAQTSDYFRLLLINNFHVIL